MLNHSILPFFGQVPCSMLWRIFLLLCRCC